MNTREILRELKSHANPDNVAGMARFGINPHHTLGVSIPTLRRLAKKIGQNHRLGQQLWASGIHEARILACLIDVPALVTSRQMDSWANGFDSWDVCDQCCGNLFDKTRFAYPKAILWSARRREFIKRAGFVLMAALAVHDKQAEDAQFIAFLPIIQRESDDERNFVRKAVNWALRQIGKRNRRLNRLAVKTARAIHRQDSKAARWIATDALRELTSRAVQQRL